MSKVFIIQGEPKEFTDDELRAILLGGEETEDVPPKLLDSIINSCIASTVAMAHADFNTAKDAQAAHNASKLMSDTLVMAVKHSVYDHLEQLIIEKLELATKSNGDKEDE